MSKSARAPIHLNIHRERGRDRAVLIVCGELDLDSARTLEVELRDAESVGSARLILDLGGVEFIDSTGIQALVGAQLRAERNQHDLLLRNPSTEVQRVLGVAGIADRFTLEN